MPTRTQGPILGIACYGANDTGVALLDHTGHLLYMSEEERFSRRKKDTAFPALAIADALRFADITAGDVSDCAFYTDLSGTALRGAVHILRNLPGSLRFLGSGGASHRRHRGFAHDLRTRTGFDGNVHAVPHHTCHAACAFFLSPFEEAAVLTLDGTGEWATTTRWLGRNNGLASVDGTDFPHSLGKVYEAFTQFLGFRPNSGEGKVMGLSAFGDPTRFRVEFQQILRLEEGGAFRVDMDWFRYHLGAERLYGRKAITAFGAPRVPESELTERDMDLAAALQERTEEAALHLALDLHARTGASDLCLAGGVALNSCMNARIARDGPFRDVYIPPPAGDPGTALGAAKYVHHVLRGGTDREELTHANWGPQFDAQSCERALQGSGFEYSSVDNPAENAARALSEGQVVGWFQGRMEIGPRALGNRSILADPRRPDMQDIVNRRVKHREGFRPFAPAVLAERCSDFFDAPGPSPFMLFVYGVRRDRRQDIPAVTHVDGTGRVQTVDREQNPRFRQLIEAFDAITGVPVVLNTSFNVRGEPIVCTPEDALACFRETGMHRLYLGDFEVTKPSD